MSELDRLPPHSLEAEEAVLGSLLIDPDAIFEVASFLKSASFYSQRNRMIYDAILALNERREPLDLITVSEELRRREQLEDAGGEATIIGLINAVPTSINAESYARVVEATAVRRQMIRAASEIANLAYQEAEDINVVIDRAERTLFSISEDRTTRDLVPVRQIASEYLDRIQELHARGDDVIGVPTGYVDLDRLLGGLNKSDLIIVAARPGMGKTSLQNAMALTAARRFGKRVAMFNLEMSGEQLVQRMIAAETRIDSQRLRRGDLQEHEWPIFLEAIGRLSETRIFIDDTPSITPNQLRTKCRRLYAEHGLDLVMIDYLQLMQAEFTKNNRVQEISEISRSLKGLARELNVPVVAAAQLSRAVEQRQDKRPLLSDLRDSGCLTGETLVTMSDTGQRIPIRELVGQSGFAVWAVDPTTYRLTQARVCKAFCTGRKPVYKLTTQLGRTIRATGNHPFLTIDGWRRLDEIGEGRRIALPRLLRTNVQEATMTHSELALLGHLIGDGCTLPNHAIQYTTRETDLASLVERLAVNIFGEEIQPLIKLERNWYQIPAAIWHRYVIPILEETGMTHRELHAALGKAYSGSTLFAQNVSRDRAARIAQVTQSIEMTHLANSDVYWDKVVSIESDGVEEVFDLTVPGPHNFVANDIFVHNSIEQDADIVMFIYRDEYYHPDTTERPNIAEINIAKHRNGPTGSIDLFWHGRLATFRNLQRQEIDL